MQAKKRILTMLTAMMLTFPASLMAQPERIEYYPSATYLFGQRDGADLFIDVYDPAPGSETAFEGHAKPAILWLFGGGFVGGERNDPGYSSWFKLLNDEGYRVISADYVPSLKGEKLGFKPWQLISTAKKFVKACAEVGVQDCFAATRYILDNAQALDVDPQRIVLAGSSAGAMIALTAEWELVNGMPNAGVLPEGFNYAGIMSFAGAIMSGQGSPSWNSSPCPQLLFHGTEDSLVNYNKIQAFKYGIFGTSSLVERLKKQGYPYWAVRLEGRGHDVAGSMIYLWKWEKDWLEQNVILGHGRISDETVNDPTMPSWWKGSLKVYEGLPE